jgi:hypothetical protein
MNSQPRFQSLRTEVLSRTGPVPRELLRDLRATSSVCSRRLCALRLPAAVADTSPESVALSLGGFRLKNGQLNAPADRLATGRRSRGVGPDMWRALWRFGKPAAIPTARFVPARRALRAIVGDAGAPVLISRSALLRSGLAPEVPSVVNLDSRKLNSTPAHTPFPSAWGHMPTPSAERRLLDRSQRGGSAAEL